MKNILSNIKSCCCSSSLGFPKGALSDLIRNVYFDQETRDIVIEFIVGDSIKEVRINVGDLMERILELILDNLNRTVYRSNFSVINDVLILDEEEIQSIGYIYKNNFIVNDAGILILDEQEIQSSELPPYKDDFFVYDNILELGEITA